MSKEIDDFKELLESSKVVVFDDDGEMIKKEKDPSPWKRKPQLKDTEFWREMI